MKSIIQFVCTSKKPYSTGGTRYEFNKGKLHKISTFASNSMSGHVFSCQMKVGADLFEFELYTNLEPYLLALQNMLRTVLVGKMPETKIDIPDYDVDLIIRKLGADDFLVELSQGDKILQSYLADGALIQASIDALPAMS